VSKIFEPKIIIHGGAGLIESPDFTERQYDRALRMVVKEAYATLLESGARQAVLRGIRLMEDHPLFNAGYGSRLQRDGKVRMSAAIMDSKSLKFSGVINICNVKNPIDVADILKSKRHSVLGGKGATEFARKNKKEYYSPIAPHRLKEHNAKVAGETGTVGVVALDAEGCICAGTSTGGIGYETPGRVSDSATVAGTYVSKVCGVSCTGKGEMIVSRAVAARIVTKVEDGLDLAAVVHDMARDAQKSKLRYGFITLNNKGEFAVGNGHNTRVLFATYDGKKARTFYKKKTGGNK